MTSQNSRFPADLAELDKVLRNFLDERVATDDQAAPDEVIRKCKSIAETLLHYIVKQYGGKSEYSTRTVAVEILQPAWPKTEAARKHRVRCHLHGATKCIVDAIIKLESIMHTDASTRNHDLLVARARTLLNTVVDLRSFPPVTGVSSRRFPYALESHRLALLNYGNINNRHKFIGSLSSMSVSCFLLRQALELRIFEAFGISSVVYPDERPAKPARGGTSYKEALLNIFATKGGLPLPVPLLKLVDSWCNLSVHSGWRCHSWEFFVAEAVTRSLFEPATHDIESSMTGSIRLSQEIIDVGQQAVRESMPATAFLRTKHPECFVVADGDVPPPMK